MNMLKYEHLIVSVCWLCRIILSDLLLFPDIEVLMGILTHPKEII